ncbi:MAG TPA: hypothetical protein VK817_07050 [Trebonia sp.]|jgi:DnaK suppressor protein|nr:hypothetical protein [Trebonia sp.]
MRRERRGQDAPRWRIILETRWRDRLAEVTELSLAYHSADHGAGLGAGLGADHSAEHRAEDEHARRLLHSAVAARRRLADTEDALRRLSAGSFGECEQCAAPIPHVVLAAAPETRYCPVCAAAALAPRAMVPAPRPPSPRQPSPPVRELIPVPRVPADSA